MGSDPLLAGWLGTQRHLVQLIICERVSSQPLLPQHGQGVGFLVGHGGSPPGEVPGVDLKVLVGEFTKDS